MKRNNYKIVLLLVFASFLLVFSGLYIITNPSNKNLDNEKDNVGEEYDKLNVHNNDILKFNLSYKLNNSESNTATIIFGSDYQGSNRYFSTKNILEQLKKYVDPDLFVFLGDYQDNINNEFYYSEQGLYELGSLFYYYFNNELPMLFVQGNHDISSVYGLSKTGMYNYKKFVIYVINEDDYPWRQSQFNSEDLVKNTARKLDMELSKMLSKDRVPVFIAAHVPLHYSTRSEGLDNIYAKYIIDVLNKYGNKLDIFYLFGHNHSGNDDDYIGGSINYISKGSNMYVGGTNEKTSINFTYLNGGYVGYSNNSVNNFSTNVTSMTAIIINDQVLSIQKYTADGPYYDKSFIIDLLK